MQEPQTAGLQSTSVHFSSFCRVPNTVYSDSNGRGARDPLEVFGGALDLLLWTDSTPTGTILTTDRFLRRRWKRGHSWCQRVLTVLKCSARAIVRPTPGGSTCTIRRPTKGYFVIPRAAVAALVIPGVNDRLERLAAIGLLYAAADRSSTRVVGTTRLEVPVHPMQVLLAEGFEVELIQSVLADLVDLGLGRQAGDEFLLGSHQLVNVPELSNSRFEMPRHKNGATSIIKWGANGAQMGRSNSLQPAADLPTRPSSQTVISEAKRPTDEQKKEEAICYWAQTGQHQHIPLASLIAALADEDELSRWTHTRSPAVAQVLSRRLSAVHRGQCWQWPIVGHCLDLITKQWTPRPDALEQLKQTLQRYPDPGELAVTLGLIPVPVEETPSDSDPNLEQQSADLLAEYSAEMDQLLNALEPCPELLVDESIDIIQSENWLAITDQLDLLRRRVRAQLQSAQETQQALQVDEARADLAAKLEEYKDISNPISAADEEGLTTTELIRLRGPWSRFERAVRRAGTLLQHSEQRLDLLQSELSQLIESRTQLPAQQSKSDELEPMFSAPVDGQLGAKNREAESPHGDESTNGSSLQDVQQAEDQPISALAEDLVLSTSAASTSVVASVGPAGREPGLCPVLLAASGPLISEPREALGIGSTSPEKGVVSVTSSRLGARCVNGYPFGSPFTFLPPVLSLALAGGSASPSALHQSAKSPVPKRAAAAAQEPPWQPPKALASRTPGAQGRSLAANAGHGFFHPFASARRSSTPSMLERERQVGNVLTSLGVVLSAEPFHQSCRPRALMPSPSFGEWETISTSSPVIFTQVKRMWEGRSLMKSGESWQQWRRPFHWSACRYSSLYRTARSPVQAPTPLVMHLVELGESGRARSIQPACPERRRGGGGRLQRRGPVGRLSRPKLLGNGGADIYQKETVAIWGKTTGRRGHISVPDVALCGMVRSFWSSFAV